MSATVEPERVEPGIGWGVLHLFYRVDTRLADEEPGGAKRVLDAIRGLEADGTHQALVFAVLGHKADLGVMALGPDLARLQAFQHEMSRAPLEPTWSYVSLTEQSEYGATEDDERARLAAEDGVTDPTEVESRLVAWRERIEHYREQRIHPRLPAKRAICFYPMSKRRTHDDNWYGLSFEERKRLMAGHARVGRTYAGRVLQLITGSTGHRRLGVGRHVARRRPGGAQGDRLRDALRRGVDALRRVRAVHHRPRARSRRRPAPGGPRRVRAGGEPDSEPSSESAALERLRQAGDAIVTGVDAQLPAWVVAQVCRILDAWGRADDATRARAEADAVDAGSRAAARVTAELRDLFALDPAEQRVTPLEIVRSAVREPTGILVTAGVPPIDRDAFAERSFPDDRYGLVPVTLGDLGDEELGPLQLVWGMAKAAVLEARREHPPPS